MPVLTPTDVLGPGGLIAAKLPAYESRPQQLDMAETVATALREGGHAIVEAPTGVGKSFAYLVPLALHAIATNTKVVISTGTIALQEQLVGKDIPLLQQIFPELKAVLVKGRQNYLSRRRLGYALDAQQAIFETRDDAAALRELADWAKESVAGDLADLGFDPSPQVWRIAQSDRSNCLGRKCPTYESCFFYNARRAMEGAHLLIVNHHLYFSDLSLRDEHAAILPAHDVVVFDEAHTLEDVATDHLGTSISEAQVRYWLDGLWSRKGKGLLAQEPYAFAREQAEHAREMSEHFWKNVAQLPGANSDTIPLVGAGVVDNPLSPALDSLGKALEVARERADDDNAAQELGAQIARAAALSGSLRMIIEQRTPQHVYYAHVPTARGTPSLSMAPLSVAELLKEKLFAATRTVILTSATLAADDSERFLFLRRRLGLEGGLAKRLDSPFDYQRQAKLLLNAAPIDPNSPRYEHALSAWLSEYLAEAQGGTFVLFTSYRQLKAVHDLVRPTLDRANRFVLRHGDGMGRGADARPVQARRQRRAVRHQLVLGGRRRARRRAAPRHHHQAALRGAQPPGGRGPPPGHQAQWRQPLHGAHRPRGHHPPEAGLRPADPHPQRHRHGGDLRPPGADGRVWPVLPARAAGVRDGDVPVGCIFGRGGGAEGAGKGRWRGDVRIRVALRVTSHKSRSHCEKSHGMSPRSGRKKLAQGASPGTCCDKSDQARGAGDTISHYEGLLTRARKLRKCVARSAGLHASPPLVPGLTPCPLPTSHGITRGPGNEEPAGRESRAPTARPNPSPGQRPGNEIPIKTFASPAGAAQTACRQRRLGRPCRARFLFYRGTQGVALGWDWAAPPALWTVGAGHGREMWVMSRAHALG